MQLCDNGEEHSRTEVRKNDRDEKSLYAHSESRNEDKIEYQWFKYVGPTEEQIKIDIDKAEKGEYLPTQLDELIDGANKNNVQIINTVGNEQGFYYCRVTNTYNGTTSIKCSNFFNVIDTKINA